MKIILILSSLVTLSCFLYVRRDQTLESFSLGEFFNNEFNEPKSIVNHVNDFFDTDSGDGEGE